MSKADDYRANLAVCWRMADKAPNEREKRAWLDMAESWRLLIWSTGEEFDSAAQGHGTGPFNPIPDLWKASVFIQLRHTVLRLRRWFSAKDRSLGAMPAIFFVRIIQGAGAFLWLALDAFNRQRNAHYRRDTHRIGTASRGGDSRRNLTPSHPPPTVHQPDTVRPMPASRRA